MKLEVKNVKTFTGNEGDGFNATLYGDGEKLAFVINSADGGEYHYHWVSQEVEQKFNQHIQSLSPEPLEEWEKEFSQKSWMPMSADIVVAGLVDEYEKRKNIRRMSKTKTVFRRQGDAPDIINYLKIPYGPAALTYLRKKYPDATVYLHDQDKWVPVENLI